MTVPDIANSSIRFIDVSRPLTPEEAPHYQRLILPLRKQASSHTEYVARVLQFRKDVIQRGYKSEEFAGGVYLMCKQDLLFFVNTFLWTYDPRRDDVADSPYPFVTWPFQGPTLIEIDKCIGRHDLLIQKSRDMGASWMILVVFLWRFLFKRLQSFLVASRKEDLVDASGNPDSLFWKFDFMVERLPEWIRPRTTRTYMHYANDETESVIDGESTNKDLGQAGRRTALLLDEMARMNEGLSILEATADVTRSRVFNSSFSGTGDAFYTHSRKCQVQIKLPWWLHPEKASGLYYGPNGKMRSPWYDTEEARRHPWEMANQIDMNPEGGNFGFFEEPLVNRLLALCAPELRRGSVTFESGKLSEARFTENRDEGQLRLWAQPNNLGCLPRGRPYVIGADVATGSASIDQEGASNSVLSVLDASTGEYVAEFASGTIDPWDLAELATAMGFWLAGSGADPVNMPLVIWEHHGPGTQFAKAMRELEYPRLYLREDNEAKRVPSPSDRIGWAQGVQSKKTLLGDYRNALKSGRVTNRSTEAILELRGYIYDKNGEVDWIGNQNFVDPTQAKSNHGDRVIASALAWTAAQPIARRQQKSEEREIPADCFYRRQQEARKEREKVGMY